LKKGGGKAKRKAKRWTRLSEKKHKILLQAKKKTRAKEWSTNEHEYSLEIGVAKRRRSEEEKVRPGDGNEGMG